MLRLPQFTKAADNIRPYNSHRYDVFAPKLNRTLTLYGRISLDAWIILESDPDVEYYCERPLVIPDTKPKRVIDFWIKRKENDQFLFLLRPSEIAVGIDGITTIPAFRAWAESNMAIIKFIDPAVFHEKKILLTNWGWIIRDLSAFGRFLPPDLCNKVSKIIQLPASLADIERNFFDLDPILIRIAIFSLMHSGHAVCQDLDSAFFGPLSVIESL